VSTPVTAKLAWYAARAGRMSPAEVASRARDQALRLAWQRRQVRPGQPVPVLPAGELGFSAVLPGGTEALVPGPARDAVLASAAMLLAGEWDVLGVARTDLAAPDWFHDPVTGRRSDPDRYSFRINTRSAEQTGNIKQVWEISRLQHLTLLATAWYLSREEAYADRVAAQLRSWWQQNPFLSGVHWTSGIEVGVRLISLAWIRRLLNDWPGAEGLFERSPQAVAQIRWHQQFLAAFRSSGSSSNNHVIAEAAGQLVASCAFPWFAETPRWRRDSAALLTAELAHNTFGSGLNRELASDYHCFVAELGLLAAAEARASGHPLGEGTTALLCATVDCAAALLDEQLRPPRQGDGDEGRAVLLDAPVPNRWPGLLAIGEALFGRRDWWPAVPQDVTSTLIRALAPPAGPVTAGRPAERPWHFADAGLTLLRTEASQGPEIWCRCDGGPHGFLSIAAHAHADALSVEVRCGGVDVLADPGTFAYQGEPAWRSYSRSTLGHNTVQLAGANQSREGGPFLWLRHAGTTVTEVRDDGDTVCWAAGHDGYQALDPPARHHRRVRLDRTGRRLEITDEVTGGHSLALAFHLGPDVEAELDGATARLHWPAGQDGLGRARLELPAGLEWSLHRGSTEPILGWYSPGLGRRVPAVTLIGRGLSTPGTALLTQLIFAGAQPEADTVCEQSGVSLLASDALVGELSSTHKGAG
jgi:hypothetical protein